MKKFLIMASLLCSTSVKAVNIGATPEDLLTLNFSNKGHTRLGIQNEKITEIFVSPEDAAKVVLPKSTGEAIVLANPEYKHVYLTIMGEWGTKQDLKINFTSKEPSPIFLVPKKEQKNLAALTDSESEMVSSNSERAESCQREDKNLQKPKKKRYLFSRTKSKKEDSQLKEETTN